MLGSQGIVVKCAAALFFPTVDCDYLAHVFPRFASVTCNYFECGLVHCITCVLYGWLEWLPQKRIIKTHIYLYANCSKIFLCIIVLTTGSNILEYDDSSSRSHDWLVFSVDEFHYLNAALIASSTAYDDFDCTFKCRRNPFCLSSRNIEHILHGSRWHKRAIQQCRQSRNYGEQWNNDRKTVAVSRENKFHRGPRGYEEIETKQSDRPWPNSTESNSTSGRRCVTILALFSIMSWTKQKFHNNGNSLKFHQHTKKNVS